MDDFIDLDSYLELYSGARDELIVSYYESIIEGLLRKFVAEGNKVELNLQHHYKDIYLDATINDQDPSKVKVTWREINAGI